jgi:hypothetical protein
VSGSYSPGDVFLFRGLGKGAYAAGAKLLSINGAPARAGLASSVAITDWDGDGKLDLIVGNINGGVSLLRNASKGGKLEFEAPRRLLGTSGLERVNSDAAPLVVDWNGDGIADLIVGADDGSITLFKGKGAGNAHTLEPGIKLIPSLTIAQRESKSVPVDPATGELMLPPLERPLIRSKPAVYDWNGDGKLDLIVGDFEYFMGAPRELTVEERRKKEELEQQWRTLDHSIQELIHTATLRASAELGVSDSWSYPHSRDRERVNARRDSILDADPHYAELSQQSKELSSKLDVFKPKYSSHGFVWVYLRK